MRRIRPAGYVRLLPLLGDSICAANLSLQGASTCLEAARLRAVPQAAPFR